MDTKSDSRLTFTQSLCCTALAGCITRTFTAPLDVLKITKQVGLKESAGSLLSTFKNIHSQDKYHGFWKGNKIACIKILPFSLVHYVVYQQLKWELSDDLGRMSLLKRLLTGISAGIFATVVVYPLDLMKTRFIVQPYDKKMSMYKGIFDSFLKIYRYEGKRSLYKGLTPTLIGSVPYAVSTFIVYELLDKVWLQPRHHHSTLEVMLHGCIASAVAITVSFPFDVVKRKIQAYSPVLKNNGGVDITAKRPKDCAMKILLNKGRKGFWQGLTPALIRVVPYHSCLFLSYDICKRIFLYQNGYSLDDNEVDRNLDIEELEEIKFYDIELPIDQVTETEEQP